MGRQKGLTEEKLAALSDPRGSEVYTPEERAVLDLADAMSDTPAVIPDELFARLRGFYDDARLVELTSALAWENYRARFNRVFDLPAEGFSEGATCPTPAATGDHSRAPRGAPEQPNA